jgi:hypothetical protein
VDRLNWFTSELGYQQSRVKRRRMAIRALEGIGTDQAVARKNHARVRLTQRGTHLQQLASVASKSWLYAAANGVKKGATTGPQRHTDRFAFLAFLARSVSGGGHEHFIYAT